MQDERRTFLKTALAGAAVGVTALVSAKTGLADEKTPPGSNGVVVGHSPKKEILYHKTQDWDIYYKSAY